MITFYNYDIDYAILVEKLLSGAIMVYPTDTVAGIGCVGNLKSTVNKLYEIKGREMNKVVSYAFSNKKMIQKFAEIPPSAEKLFDLLPGPLTLILPLKSESPPLYGLDGKTIGIRIPEVPWLLKLITLIDYPLITTSANISGKPSAKNVNEINKEILEKIDILIEWEGNLSNYSSTVVSLIENPKILRKGIISEDMIFERLNS